MGTTPDSLDTRAIESGFWHGVARAHEHGLEIKPALSNKERDGFLEELRNIMTEKCQLKEGGYWNPRAIQHASECLTIFFLARTHYQHDQLGEEGIKDFLFRYGGNPGGWANSWMHPRR